MSRRDFPGLSRTASTRSDCDVCWCIKSVESAEVMWYKRQTGAMVETSHPLDEAEAIARVLWHDRHRHRTEETPCPPPAGA